MSKGLFCLVPIVMIFCTSCSDSYFADDKSREKNADSIPYFAGELRLPLKIDSSFIARADTAEPLRYNALRSMKAQFASIENDKQLQYFINDFCRIDSMKALGQYGKYAEGLDVGMMQNASAFRLGNIRLNDKTDLLLWRLHFSSFDACPFYNGTLIVGSLRRGNTYTHLPLGKLYNSGDPPGFMTETLTSELTQDWIAINTVTTSDEDTETPGEKKETRCYTVQIKEVRADSVLSNSTVVK
jgi:hypothetical protein